MLLLYFSIILLLHNVSLIASTETIENLFNFGDIPKLRDDTSSFASVPEPISDFEPPLLNNKKAKKYQAALENWTGKWMPESDSESTTPLSKTENSAATIHSVPMGNQFENCDDGKTNLTVDWDNSKENYTCTSGQEIPSLNSIKPEIYCLRIPPAYRAIHMCMNHTITYDDNIPMYGTHRPVWPVYGEYKFIPRQRWIHSLEHGAIVMLYHPCADPKQVDKLRNLVTKCLKRHIITPYNLLDEDRPLALVAWGCRLTMSGVNERWVKHFIKTKALRGPERIPTNGGFKKELINEAKIVSTKIDSKLCPFDQREKPTLYR